MRTSFTGNITFLLLWVNLILLAAYLWKLVSTFDLLFFGVIG